MNEIVINIQPFEKRIAVLEMGKLAELYVEKEQQQNIVGNIYKGFVKNVLPGMGAAFIDIGLERTAFLHYSDIVTDFFETDETDTDLPAQSESKLNSDSSRIGDILHEGQEIVVQIQKGPIGRKGARVTCHISIPGKYLVLFPNKKKIALSRKIHSINEKKRIREILTRIKNKDVGLIVRTDAEGNSEEDFVSEYKGLEKTWSLIEKRIRDSKPLTCIYEENNLKNKLIRDLFSSKIDKLVIDHKKMRNELVSIFKDISSEMIERIELYKEDSPIFDAFGIEKEIEKMFNSKIFLPSGGNIIIEQTEALVSIDINTGSFVGNKNYETTVRQTNIEASYEIARQLRLRDLSGVIVIDYIDMYSEESRIEVFDVLKKALKKDRAKTKAYFFGPLGLVEVTRKRSALGILSSYSEQCPSCNGTGRIISRDSVAMNIYRWLCRGDIFIKNKPLKILLHPNVKFFLDNNPDYLKSFGNQIIIESNESLKPDEFRVILIPQNKDITETHNT